MAMIVSQIFRQKLEEIQSRIPVKISGNEAPIDGERFETILQEQMTEKTNQNKKEMATTNIINSMVSPSGKMNIPTGSQAYQGMIQGSAGKYSVDASLIQAVMQAESSFNPTDVSSAGAMGLMQLMPATAKGLGVTNPFDPAQNIDGGVRYLKQMLDRYHGDVKMALAAYNAGTGTLNRLGIKDLDDPTQFNRLPSETKNYIKRIYGFMGKAL